MTSEYSPAYRAVHPHACGEHTMYPVDTTGGAGSSPRMWGTPQQIESEPAWWRFIPTHVGNTRPRLPGLCPLAVHPHACGEHYGVAGVTADNFGSSPRMWGTRELEFDGVAYTRFIPTHVGNTPAKQAARRGETVHPHACGEHTVSRENVVLRPGSSPRMWGTLQTYLFDLKGKIQPTKFHQPNWLFCNRKEVNSGNSS